MFSRSLANFIVLSLALTHAVHGAPLLQKRIAQVIAESTSEWEQACLAAGGAQECNPLSITSFSALLAGADACAQQDAADAQIDLAKSLGNDSEMIRLSQLFVQQPRNTPNSVATPYCQTAPKNDELAGLHQCQFEGANQQTFVGGVSIGDEGTIPFGLNAPLDPPGSCPANTDGPIPDGVQLRTITEDPGVGNAGANDGGEEDIDEEDIDDEDIDVGVDDQDKVEDEVEDEEEDNGAAGGDFKTQNGIDAQVQNAEFETLDADSPCTDGETACVEGGFAQCVSGSFVVTQCAGELECFALPLVNSPGTSIACTTAADAEARIAASGATGGITGDGADVPAPIEDEEVDVDVDVEDEDEDAGAAGGDFKTQNGIDAQDQNAEFETLDADSPCTDGEAACVEGGFAQCVGGAFVIQQCAGELQCFALPLVNSPGTSITCTTADDAEARIAASGAAGGITGDGSASPAPSQSSTPAPTASSSSAPAPTSTAAPADNGNDDTSAGGDFKAQNGRDAQRQNEEFAALDADSPCTAGDTACIDGGFAQCVNGSFVVTQCSGDLQCFALPLVNAPGTSLTCTTAADAKARIAASGA